ncbi:O-methyltransferase [Demequina sp. SYSU T00039]|uniref:O-methyltransferase n=1 Tax=Demequina lignilytica TaxID=3051663 RepID=A0AAW7M7X5_9MICO|nr:MULTISPECIES: O-methyltransferase [unclassified Demequina]MDN4477681.1 O-methyltransferase [Demequina sp. SYSU T00039-1]MDN4487968.1 O-methyltransferase [Demequina sp. SYSU T00039]MDN4490408.1 O-methyltransferase [Demequina sp. SYSU T00068]
MSIEAANWAYAEDFIAEDRVLLEARDVADELGCAPVLPGAGRAMQVLARTMRAATAVEIGTGAAVSTTYLLRGMAPTGVVTSIDVEPEHHKAARRTLTAAGFAPERARLITGRALDVLPRLTDAGYDIVFIDARKSEYPAYLEHAMRLLKPGGLLLMDNALWHGRVADPAQRDQDTTAVRETLRTVREDERLTTALLTAGDGLLAAVKG